MASAIVIVKDHKGHSLRGRVLLDTCATANFVAEGFAKRLNLPMSNCSFSIDAIGSMSTISKSAMQIHFKSLYTEFSKTLTFLVVPTIADLVPSEPFPKQSINVPKNLDLADPQFHEPRKVEMLIGAGATLSMFSTGQIIVGCAPTQGSINRVTCKLTSLSEKIADFWNIKELENEKALIDKGNVSYVEHYVRTSRRELDGTYTVFLPFRDENRDFGNSYKVALHRLYALECKFDQNKSFKTEYTRVFKEYLELGHMSEVSNPKTEGFYLPHHAVFKSDSTTTKLRIVFDASAKTEQGRSLNDALLVGPTIQPQIFEHLLKLRLHKYILIGDIEKMYRQISIGESDRKYQCVLWRVGHQIKTYELNTVTFGISAAPFLAISTVHRLAEDEEINFPFAAKVLKRDLYVEDLVTGADTWEELQPCNRKSENFYIREASICESGQQITRESLNKGSIQKALGLSWNIDADEIVYEVKTSHLSDDVTKREILSTIAKIYDPLGLLGPIILYAKTIMQTTWKEKSSWDEAVSENLRSKWKTFAKQLPLINNLVVNRQLLVEEAHNVQIHALCDASRAGYGACIYLRSINRKGEVQCRLVCAKSRVSPLKVISTPRAELCGALLLTQLYKQVAPIISHITNSIYFWCDSMIVLHWLKTSPERLKPFISNRVRQIQKIAAIDLWRHVSSENNPSDALSRGQLPEEFLKNRSWFEGLSFLQTLVESWPPFLFNPSDRDIPELRKESCLITKLTLISEIINRFSSYEKTIRVMAYCLRFVTRQRGTITCKERLDTETKLLKLIQRATFQKEIQEIQNGGE
ncbi:uncharacterized protein [Prorops nasuta]|uniref:uncharacterized protein n=1 Tax=Prorops nasuta TaxID=863751 RepID=UPI0034CEBBEA